MQEPQNVRWGENEILCQNIIVRDIAIPTSKFVATIWGDWNIQQFDVREGEMIQMEFTIQQKKCADGGYRNNNPKIQNIKKLSKNKEGYIGDALYVIARDDKSALKIGRSRNVKKRLASLQTSSNVELKIIGLFKRCGFLESEIHEELEGRGLRLKGEWFKYCQETYDVVKEYCENYG